MSDIAIKVENISKKYVIGNTTSGSLRESLVGIFNKNQKKLEDFWALNDVSFEINKGEAVGIIGKNGAGKSTLLKVLSRITEPTNGRITINGRVASLLEVGTGFHPELTGRENIFLNGTILGMTKSEVRAKFDEIVEFSGVQKFIDTPVKHYSSGMYVRLAFAVAAHLKPQILIVDEVLAVGDAEFQKKCLGKMGEVANEGRTVLFVSHNMNAVLELTKRAIFLEKGTLRQSGPSSEIVSSYLKSAYKNKEWNATHQSGKPIQIQKIAVVGKRTTQDDLELQIEYQIREKVRNATIAVIIHAWDGAQLFSTEDIDSDLSLLENRKIGKYNSKIVIPHHFITKGTYNIRVSCGIIGVEVFENIETISFDVEEMGDLNSKKHRTGGYLSPDLKWETSEI